MSFNQHFDENLFGMYHLNHFIVLDKNLKANFSSNMLVLNQNFASDLDHASLLWAFVSVFWLYTKLH